MSALLDTADLLRTKGPNGTTDRPRTVKLARRALRGHGQGGAQAAPAGADRPPAAWPAAAVR